MAERGAENARASRVQQVECKDAIGGIVRCVQQYKDESGQPNCLDKFNFIKQICMNDVDFFLMLSSTLLQIRITFCISYLMHYLLSTTKKVKISEFISEVYINHWRKYMINLRFIFYESLQAQC